MTKTSSRWLALAKGAALGTVILVTLLALAGPAFTAPAGPAIEAAAAGEPITYLAGKGTTTFHVPPQVRPGGAAPQTASITVNYIAAGGTLLSKTCKAWPAQAQTAFNYAVNIWAATLNSAAPTVIEACWTTLGSGILGQSGATEFYKSPSFPFAETWYPSSLANAMAGYDIAPTVSEMRIVYSDAIPWYFGTDGATPLNTYDLVSVVLHEIAHGLGFAGSMTVSGSYGYWGWNVYTQPAAYDRFTENGGGTALLSYGNGSTDLKTQLTSGNVYFDGAHADAANGGNRPELYAPASWAGGSSYAHLDESFNGTVNALMTYSLNDGESIHNLGPVTLGVLQDVGWTTADAATPTPTRTSTATPTRTATPTPIPAPDVSIAKAVILGRAFTPGDRVTYTLAISNVGNLPATTIRITDTLPAGLVSTSYTTTLSVTPVAAPNYAWTLASLSAGAGGVISVYAQIDASWPATRPITNTAFVSAPADRDPLNNASSAYIGVARIYLPLVIRAYTLPSPATATPTVTATPTTGPQWTNIVTENFEGSFPSVWDVFDNGNYAGQYYWAKSNCRAFSGAYSGWAVGAGANGGGLGCGANYPDNGESWMMYGPISLAGATAAELRFKQWVNSESGYDKLCRFASINGSNFYGSCLSGNSGGWVDAVLDLSNVYTLGDLRGQANVWIALVFTSDDSFNYAEGAYADDIVLRKCLTGSCPSASAPEGAGTQDTEASFTLRR